MVLDKLLKGRKEKAESTAKTELLHSRLTRQAVKRPTRINGTKAAKHQNANVLRNFHAAVFGKSGEVGNDAAEGRSQRHRHPHERGDGR